MEFNETDEFILSPVNAEKYHSFSGHDYYSNRPTIVKLEWKLVNKTKNNYTIELISASNEMNENLSLIVNNKEYIISPENEIEGVSLKVNAMNSIELLRKDQSNPHKGLNIEGLKLIIK